MNTLTVNGVLFAIGVVAVAFTVIIFVRAWRHTPNLEARLSSVKQFVHRKVRSQRVIEELERAKGELAVAEKRLAKLNDEKNELVESEPGADEEVSGYEAWIGASVLFLFAAGLLAYLGGGSSMFGIGQVGWALAASPVTAGLVVVIHLLFSAAFTDRSRPAVTRRRARLGVVVSLTLLVVFLTTSRLGTVTTSESFETLIALSLWGVAALADVAAGFATVKAMAHFADSRLTNEIFRYENLIRAYRKHLVALDADLESYTSAPTAAPNGDGAAALLFALFLFGHAALASPLQPAQPTEGACSESINGSVAGAGVGKPASGDVQRNVTNLGQIGAAPPGAAPSSSSGSCAVLYLIDDTTSTDRASRRTGLTALARGLPHVLDALACESAIVQITGFSSDSVRIDTLTEVAIPATAEPLEPCEALGPAAVMAKQALSDRVFPERKRVHEQKALEACAVARTARARDQDAVRARSITDAQQKLLEVEDARPRGCRTALYAVTRRALLTASEWPRTSVFVLTDGVDNTSRSMSPLPIPSSSGLLFVLIPSSDPTDGGERMEARGRVLERLFRGSRVTMFNDMALDSYWLRSFHATRLNAGTK
jgi:hypothetical protein